MAVVGLIEIDLQDFIFAQDALHPASQDGLAQLAFESLPVGKKQHLRDLLCNRASPFDHLTG
jgi:hypothetical protein